MNNYDYTIDILTEDDMYSPERFLGDCYEGGDDEYHTNHCFPFED